MVGLYCTPRTHTHSLHDQLKTGFTSPKWSEGNRERTAAVSSSSRRVKERKKEREMSLRSLQNNNMRPLHIKINTGLCQWRGQLEENRQILRRVTSDNNLRFSIYFIPSLKPIRDTNAPDPSQMGKKVLINLEDHCGPESISWVFCNRNASYLAAGQWESWRGVRWWWACRLCSDRKRILFKS